MLRLVDKLISEGHSPTHFARQMVRFLRNAVVARVAGADSSLLQISSDERRRVARIAELFEEEDLARHLQIMLRTHGELGYRQEQRFHLELGLLKMAHAQRLLPIEQLLSDAAGAGVFPSRGKTLGGAGDRKGEQATRVAFDCALHECFTVRGGFGAQERIQAGAFLGKRAAVGVAHGRRCGRECRHGIGRAGCGCPAGTGDFSRTAARHWKNVRVDVRDAVLNALSGAGQRILINMLETAEWQVEGNEVVIKVASSATVIEMSLGADAKRLMIATASGALGRADEAAGGAGRSGSDCGAARINQWRRPRPGGAGPGGPAHEGKIRSRDSHDY